MGYRDELDALRVRNEALTAELEQCQSELSANREKAQRLQTELKEQTARVAELEMAMGGSLGREAQRRTDAKRKITAGSLMLLIGLTVGAAFWTRQTAARGEMRVQEAQAQQQQAEAAAAATRAENARLEMINAELQTQLRALATRRARRSAP